MSHCAPTADYRSQLAQAVAVAQQAPAKCADALALHLYAHWYTPAIIEPPLQTSQAELLAHLRAADASGSQFEPDWIVLDDLTGARFAGPPATPWQTPVARLGEIRWVDPVDYIYTGSIGLRPPPGASLLVSRRRDSTTVLPGWWSAASPEWPRAVQPKLRVYWSVMPGGVCYLVEALTSLLGPVLPYALKCPTATSRYHRPDAVTLYIAATAWETARSWLRAVHARSLPWMRDCVPAFTLPLLQGMAVAEDPGAQSFGMSRCKLLGEAIWSNGPGQHATRDRESLRAIAERHLGANGIRLDAPYLNPGSDDWYAL